jgi:uncharacterized LabA/DUF88 family protein/uncharacterized protein YqfB (UPF0267 family)
MKKEKVAIYIDGGNTYRRLKSIGIPQKSFRFDFSAFIDHLVGDRTLISKRYYVGIVRNVDSSEKSDKMVMGQQKFLSSLETEGFEIKRGKIMYDDGNIREKGVDVKLSLDLTIGAVDSWYDTAIVISSDTDLIPAIQYIRSAKKKNIEYVGFGVTPSFGMIKECSVSRIFSDTDLFQFQSKTVKFRETLAELVLKGEKTATWRLFDDKDLKVGDLLNLQIWETGKDFAKAKRKQFVSRIITGDYDAIVIGDSQFEKIPMSREKQVTYIHDKLGQLREIKLGSDSDYTEKAAIHWRTHRSEHQGQDKRIQERFK